MILVTLGTQQQQFTRLLEYIENSNIKDEIRKEYKVKNLGFSQVLFFFISFCIPNYYRDF